MKTKTKPQKKARNKLTLVAFLLDRTGSMAACKDETIKGFNGYIDWSSVLLVQPVPVYFVASLVNFDPFRYPSMIGKGDVPGAPV